MRRSPTKQRKEDEMTSIAGLLHGGLRGYQKDGVELRAIVEKLDRSLVRRK